MSSLAVYDAFKVRLDDWIDTPVIYENDGFATADTPATFVFVEIFGDRLEQDSIGAPRQNMFIETGVTYLHVMAPNDTGSREARSIAGALTNLFREQVSGDVHISEMSIGAGEPGRDFPNYWSLAVTLHWYRRDITAINI